MRIVIVTQEAPVYLPEFVERFLGLLAETDHRVVSVVRFSALFSNTPQEELIQRLNYYGGRDFLRMALLIAEKKLCGHSLNKVIRKYGIPEQKTDSVNSPDFVRYIKDEDVDLIISIAAPKIFKRQILQAPKKGCINYHTALLPRYRGRVPLFWALLNDEQQTGISVHEIDEELDNGPILIQKKVDIGPDDSLHSLYLKTIKEGPRILLEAVGKIDRDDRQRIANDRTLASRFDFPTKDQVQAFRKKGKKFF